MKAKPYNTLYCADNLKILKDKIADNSIDLIYMDPPFFTQRDFKDFTDKWKGIDTYLDFIKARLIECHRVLKPTGSIFLHCDYRANYRLRVLLDNIFGKTHFKNEIIWIYHGPSSPGQKWFNRKHDSIFWFSKTSKWVFNKEKIRVPYKDPKQNLRKSFSPSGKFTALEAEKQRNKGKIPEDWWQMRIVCKSKNENTRYPTQKPLALLDRIIKASSNEGDIVLDPFCGSGTTCISAHILNRKWIGIDINKKAIQICEKRFKQENMSLF